MDACVGQVLAGTVLVPHAATGRSTLGLYGERIAFQSSLGFGGHTIIVSQSEARQFLHAYEEKWRDPGLAGAAKSFLQQVSVLVTRDGHNGPFGDQMRPDFIAEAAQYTGNRFTAFRSAQLFPVGKDGVVGSSLGAPGGEVPGLPCFVFKTPSLANHEAAFVRNALSVAREALGQEQSTVLPTPAEAAEYGLKHGFVGVIPAELVRRHGAEPMLEALVRHDPKHDGPLIRAHHG